MPAALVGSCRRETFSASLAFGAFELPPSVPEPDDGEALLFRFFS